MKSFFSHTLLILTVIAICSLAIFFRGQLLAGYERTQLSIPAEQTPIESVPIPASIRSNHKGEDRKTDFPVRSKKKVAGWKASSLSDFADAPSNIQDRIKGNIQRGTGKKAQ